MKNIRKQTCRKRLVGNKVSFKAERIFLCVKEIISLGLMDIFRVTCYICKITIVIFSLVKAGLLYLINYIIVHLCIVSSYKEEPCDEAAHW